MKLWYQSLARQTESTPYGEMLRRVIDSACDAGTTVRLQGVRESAGIGVLSSIAYASPTAPTFIPARSDRR